MSDDPRIAYKMHYIGLNVNLEPLRRGAAEASASVAAARIATLPDERLRGGVGEAEVVGDRLVRHLAGMDVEAVPEMRVLGERLLPALVGERQGEGQRRVVEREGRSAGDRP